MKPEEFYTHLADFGFPLTDRQKNNTNAISELLVEWNEKINLTAITEKDEGLYQAFLWFNRPHLAGWSKTNPSVFWISELVQAFQVFQWRPFPELDATIIDSLNKRINFSPLLAEELGWAEFISTMDEAEDFWQDKAFRAQFDIVTARAGCPYASPLWTDHPLSEKGEDFLLSKAQQCSRRVGRKPKMPLNLLLARLKTIYSMNCQTGIHAISLL